MPIFLAVVRRAWCAICNSLWDIEAGETIPERCPCCASEDWELGPESRESRLIRQGIARQRKSLNPGATSKKRQDHGKRQWRRFAPKPVENEPEK